MSTPKAFISYSWDNEAHKAWVKALAARLRREGEIDVMLDRWALDHGDQLTKFMETSIREHDRILIVLTPNYKQKSDGRKGGVGYEGDIMTGEVFNGQDARKFIPVLRSGSWSESSPSWLRGKYSVDLRGEPYEEVQYEELLDTLHGTREQAPPIGVRPAKASASPTGPAPHPSLTPEAIAILAEAAKGDGIIVAMAHDAGFAVIVNNKRFDEPNNARSEASNRDSLKKLGLAGMVERDTEATLKLTQAGFAFADGLESRGVSDDATHLVTSPPSGWEPIKITGIIANEIGTPRNDGTQGSALYAVPFQLSRRPSPEWADHFVQTWNHPPSCSNMHRSGIAQVVADRVVLDGTTVDEVAKVHRDTLKLVTEKVNQDIGEWHQKIQRAAETEAERLRQHKQAVEDAAKKISFD